MASRVYSRIVPDPPTTVPNVIGTTIQAKGKDFDQRLVQGGHKMAILTHDAAFEEQDGKHCVGVEDQLVPNDGGYWTVWSADGLIPLFRIYGSGNTAKPGWLEPLIHAGVTFKWTGKNITAGADPGHTHTQTLSVLGALLPTTTAIQYGGNIETPFYGAAIRWPKTGKLTRLIVNLQPTVNVPVIFRFRRTTGVPGDVNIFSTAVANIVLGTFIAGPTGFAFHSEQAVTDPILTPMTEGEWIIVTHENGGSIATGSLLAYHFAVIGTF